MSLAQTAHVHELIEKTNQFCKNYDAWTDCFVHGRLNCKKVSNWGKNLVD